MRARCSWQFIKPGLRCCNSVVMISFAFSRYTHDVVERVDGQQFPILKQRMRLSTDDSDDATANTACIEFSQDRLAECRDAATQQG